MTPTQTPKEIANVNSKVSARRSMAFGPSKSLSAEFSGGMALSRSLRVLVHAFVVAVNRMNHCKRISESRCTSKFQDGGTVHSATTGPDLTCLCLT